MKIYLVGGAVRDKLMGLKPKDLDYVMVLDDISISAEEGFKIMENYMINEGYKIFVSHPDKYTIRAKFPKGHKNAKQDADFVLARKEIGYKEGTREPILQLGTLYDDLERRDFTVNAMAEDEEGNIYDPFNGREDLKQGVLKTPINPIITFYDDPLRMLRAWRFHITKGFVISHAIKSAMREKKILDKLIDVVSQERIRDELLKMFKHDPVATMKLLITYDEIYCEGFLESCFGRGMWLEPTFKAK